MNLDKQKLLDRLDNRIEFYGNVHLVVAVIDGLKAAINRGDFDTEQEG